MKVLVTGAGGMLGQAITAESRRRGHETEPLPRSDLDVTNAGETRRRIFGSSPNIVVHCAAFTDVDAAETKSEAAFAANVEGTRNVSLAAAESGAAIVYPSTDYVFDGTAERPYRPEDEVSPCNEYGRSKAAGEAVALQAGNGLVLRTGWLFGAGGRNFVDTIIAAAGNRVKLEVVDDQVGRPTFTNDLAQVVLDLAERGDLGIFHATGGGKPVSWYGFARRILDRCSIDVPVDAIASEDLGRPAWRPVYSVLDCGSTERVLGRRMRLWSEALDCYLSGIVPLLRGVGG